MFLLIVILYLGLNRRTAEGTYFLLAEAKPVHTHAKNNIVPRLQAQRFIWHRKLAKKPTTGLKPSDQASTMAEASVKALSETILSGPHMLTLRFQSLSSCVVFLLLLPVARGIPYNASASLFSCHTKRADSGKVNAAPFIPLSSTGPIEGLSVGIPSR